MQQPILTHQGKDTGKQAILSKDIFGITPNTHVVYLDIKRIRAHQRQGTHKTKEKGEITASTRKIIRQKGTGNARKGSLKSGILRGGGNIFGPKPRKYLLKINKKVKKLARKSVLSYKTQHNNLLILEDFTLKTPQTKAYRKILQSLQVDQQKTLLILPKEDHTLIQAAQNLPQAHITTAKKINTYDLLYANKLLLTETALKALQQYLS